MFSGAGISNVSNQWQPSLQQGGGKSRLNSGAKPFLRARRSAPEGEAQDMAHMSMLKASARVVQVRRRRHLHDRLRWWLHQSCDFCHVNHFQT